MASNVVRCSTCGKQNRVPDAAAGVPRCAHCKASLPWVTDAGDDSFAPIAEAAAVPVLVDFWAPWCGPCRTVSPALEHLAGEMAGRLKLVKVNVDEAPQLAQKFGVQGIPTLVVLRNGREQARQVGAAPESALRTWLEPNVAADSPSPTP